MNVTSFAARRYAAVNIYDSGNLQELLSLVETLRAEKAHDGSYCA